MGALEHIFDDKRIAATILSAWLIFVLIMMWDLGLLHSGYMRLGPNTTTTFMGVTLDTWYKYNLVALFTFLNTCMNDFMSDAISPWLLNCICDFKNKYLPYPKWTCLLISQIWSIYCNVMSVFGMMIALTQIDFVLIRMLADLTVNTYTNIKFMRNKVHNYEKYKEVMQHPDYEKDKELEELTSNDGLTASS
jgi:hypothetical protein